MKIYRIGIHKKNVEISNNKDVKDDNNRIIYNKKDDLIKIKCEIDHYNSKKWEETKKSFNQYEYIYTSSLKSNNNICAITPVSRSYFKLHEMIKDLNLIETKSYCACIAEGPGGFIHCLNHHISENNINFFKIYGITLISQQDRSIPYWNQQILTNRHNQIINGKDNTGNIYNYENVIHFIQTINHNYCHFITADGGFDYSKDYNLQEESSYRLLYSEIFIALNIQKIRGNFILKVFDLFNYKTIQLIYLLYNCYSMVEIYKPLTSRNSNSEKYIICSNFQGCPIPIKDKLKEYFDKCNELYIDVPKTFINDINEYNDIFVERQINTIKGILNNINTHHSKKPSKQQIYNAQRWCELYGLPINEKCIYLN